MPRKRAEDGGQPAKQPRQRKRKDQSGGAVEVQPGVGILDRPNELDLPCTSGVGGMPGGGMPPFDFCSPTGAHPSPSMLHRSNSVNGPPHFMPGAGEDPSVYGGPPSGGFYGMPPGMSTPQPPPPYDMSAAGVPMNGPPPQSHTPAPPHPSQTPQPPSMPPHSMGGPHQFAEPQMPYFHPSHPGVPGQHPGVPMMRAIQMNPSMMFPPPYLEYRLHEINRRLYSFTKTKSAMSPDDLHKWWDAFAQEFYEDNGCMTIIMNDPTDRSPRRYSIGRQLIPRFYRTAFDNGMQELFYECRSPVREGNPYTPYAPMSLECDDMLMVTHHDRPIPCEVHTECRLFVEFGPYSEACGYRIKHWMIDMRHSRESFMFPTDQPMSPEMQDLIRRGVTRMGLPSQVVHYLKMCLIIEPMQPIMSLVKQNMVQTPRDGLKRICFETYTRRHASMQAQMAAAQAAAAAQTANMKVGPVPGTPTEDTAAKPKQTRKRQRKNAANGGATTGTASKKKAGNQTASPSTAAPQFPNVKSEPFSSPSVQDTKFMPFPPQQPVPYHDVLVVGEPSRMGSDFGEEDERTISRIENTHFDPSVVATSSALTNGQQPPQMQPGNPFSGTSAQAPANSNVPSTPSTGPANSLGMPPQDFLPDYTMAPQSQMWTPDSLSVGASSS